MEDKLPDIVQPGLDVIFVGSAAGARSAAEKIYYAHPGNRFWPTLRNIGLLPRDFKKEDFRTVLDHGIGFTDMCKVRSGSDAQIGNDAFDRLRFERTIRRAKPKAVAFTSKKAASIWLGRSTGKIEFGLQPDSGDGFPAVFVLPSPSGLASGHWDGKHWRALARWIAAKNAKRPLRPLRTVRSPE